MVHPLEPSKVTGTNDLTAIATEIILLKPPSSFFIDPQSTTLCPFHALRPPPSELLPLTSSPRRAVKSYYKSRFLTSSPLYQTRREIQFFVPISHLCDRRLKCLLIELENCSYLPSNGDLGFMCRDRSCSILSPCLVLLLSVSTSFGYGATTRTPSDRRLTVFILSMQAFGTALKR